MIAITKTAFAALLIFGSASAALAVSANDRRATVVRGTTSTTPPRGRNTTANPPVKPFPAEEKAWFDRASRVY